MTMIINDLPQRPTRTCDVTVGSVRTGCVFECLGALHTVIPRWTQITKRLLDRRGVVCSRTTVVTCVTRRARSLQTYDLTSVALRTRATVGYLVTADFLAERALRTGRGDLAAGGAVVAAGTDDVVLGAGVVTVVALGTHQALGGSGTGLVCPALARLLFEESLFWVVSLLRLVLRGVRWSSGTVVPGSAGLGSSRTTRSSAEVARVARHAIGGVFSARRRRVVTSGTSAADGWSRGTEATSGTHTTRDAIWWCWGISGLSAVESCITEPGRFGAADAVAVLATRTRRTFRALTDLGGIPVRS